MSLNSSRFIMPSLKLTAACMFILLSFLVFTASAHAEPLKISLLLGDTLSRNAVEAAKAVKKELAGGKSGIAKQGEKDVSIHVFPAKDIRKRDLAPLRESQLVIVFLMDRQLVEAVKPELEAVVKAGGKVYGVGGSYGDDHKKMGILSDQKMLAYFKTVLPANIKNLVLYALKKDFALEVPYDEPLHLPPAGIYEWKAKQIFEDFETFRRAYSGQQSPRRGQMERPWIGLYFHKFSIESGETKTIDAVIASLEEGGFNVLPVCAHPFEDALERYFLSPSLPRVRLIVSTSAFAGTRPAIVVPLLSKLNVPVITAISLNSQSEAEWRASPVGLDVFTRALKIGNPEMSGMIQPTVISSKETFVDKETGVEYVEEKPLPERIKRLADRVQAWINLQDKPNKDKKIALIYYNYPPGKQNIGAAYLNVLPQSLYEMANRLKYEGYNIEDLWLNDTGPESIKDRLFKDIHGYGRNIGNWAPGELDRLVRTGRPIMISLDIYKQWFAELPEGFQKAVLKSWGPVERNNIMIWPGARGKKFLVLPAMRYGNILFTPQPARGWEQDEKKLFHEVTLAPHHQYVAFYLWLKKEFRADAVVHVGTHGTHEWLSGKEVGFTDEDPPEALIRDLPNIYPYIVDNVGEGTQAKRRGMGVVIDYMTPPFDKAGLNRELKELVALLSDYRAAREKSPPLAAAKLAAINDLAKKIGLLTDLKMSEVKTEKDIEEIDDYITDISEKLTPFGLHAFGKAPEDKYRKSTATAILSIEKGLTEGERAKRLAELEERIRMSGPRELDSFMAALAGKYIPAAQGNDPIRNPDSLPTGNNFYSFDPTRVPAKSTYEMGAKLAKDLIEGYKQRHGVYPDKLTFILWCTETIRHEGVMESQILHLMGIRPKWDERGRVTGVEAIPRNELGRPRIDVTMIPSGLYRDVFSILMVLLDRAVTIAKNETEADNLLRAHVLKTKKMLMDKGIAEDKAERLATVRIFTEPSGAYGTNLDKVIVMSNAWEKESQVADVYFMRMSHMYGQGFWGAKEEQGREDISRTLLNNALSGTKIAIHSRSSNMVATLDNDDVFQYLGGTAMAIRTIDGKTPEVYITNMSNPKAPRQETLEKVMGREMRSRYLNPEWIKAMMKEGYAGARFVDKVTEHLWGWQVTVPEAVDGAKWQEMYETYVLDRNNLGMKDLFRQAKNMWAYQSVVARMLETVRKDYWKPEKKVIETLAEEYAKTAGEVGLACCDHTCNNPLLTKFTASVLMSVPGLAAEVSGFMKALDAMKNPVQQKTGYGEGQPQKNRSPLTNRTPVSAPDGTGKKVAGYEMQDVSAAGAPSAPIPYLFLAGFLVFGGLFIWGWRRFGR